MYLGIPSVIKDKDKRRRSLYGKAGCFRLTQYGVEYRVLSSAMMKNIDTLNFVWNQLKVAIHNCVINSFLIDYRTVCEIINNSDVELAKKVINEYNIEHICVE